MFQLPDLGNLVRSVPNPLLNYNLESILGILAIFLLGVFVGYSEKAHKKQKIY